MNKALPSREPFRKAETVRAQAVRLPSGSPPSLSIHFSCLWVCPRGIDRRVADGGTEEGPVTWRASDQEAGQSRLMPKCLDPPQTGSHDAGA